jgi:hypothetical protein
VEQRSHTLSLLGKILYLHMMVEELLELFVTEVDADLFKGVEFKDLEA